MKYPNLTDTCKNCLGCQRLEDPNFRGVDKCKWNEIEKEKIWVQERIKL